MMREQDGLNHFDNDTFDWHSWDADIIQTPEKLREVFNKLNLVGKRIVDIFSVGGSYELLKESFEELLYRQTEESGEAKQCGADPYFYYNPEFTITRGVQIDTPFIIVFDDGTRLEIDFSDYSSVALNTNSIPEGIESDTIARNFNCKKFFSPCIGKKLLGVDIKTKPHSIDHDKNAIDLFALLLEDNLRLHFNDWYDYGEVTLFYGDETPIELKITFKEMEDCVDTMSELWTPVNGIRNVATSLRSYGLGAILDDGRKCRDLIRTTCSRPTIFQGYACRYLYHNYDFAEIVVTVMHEPNDYYIMGFNVHKMGNCFWRLRVASNGKCNIDQRNPYFFTVMFKDKDNNGTLPINIIHADVIPSFLEDDYILMQVAAFASSIEYNAEGESESKITPWEIMDNDDSPTVKLRGLVLGVTKRSLSMIGHESEFLDITVQTPYGPIELVHTLDMVKQEQRQLIEKGNFVDAICVLSGDVAIQEYQRGAIHDEENFLRLLRSCFEGGDFSRLGNALTDKTDFLAEDGSGAVGREQILKYFNGRYSENRIRTRLTTTRKNNASKRAVEVMTEYPFILSLDVSNGKIERILCSAPSKAQKRRDISAQVHLLRILGDSLTNNDVSELLKVMSEDCRYSSHMSGISCAGKEAITQRWADVKVRSNNIPPKQYYDIIEAIPVIRPCESLPAVYNADYCLRLSYGEPDNLIALGFIQINADGLISEILLSRDSRYLFIDKMLKDSPQTVDAIKERKREESRHYATQPQISFGDDIFVWREADKFAQKFLSDRGFFIIRSEIEPDCVAYRCLYGERSFTVFLFAFGELKTAVLDGDYCADLKKLSIAEDSTVLVLYVNVSRYKKPDGKFAYRIANYAWKDAPIELWQLIQAGSRNILMIVLQNWMMDRIFTFIRAFNDLDLDVLQALFAPVISMDIVEVPNGRVFNDAAYDHIVYLRQKYGSLHMGYVRVNDVLYSIAPGLVNFGYLGFSFDKYGKITNIKEYSIDGEHKEFILTFDEVPQTSFADVPDIVSVEMLPPEPTQHFAMKLVFCNGEIKKYTVPSAYTSESDIPPYLREHVFSDRFFAGGELQEYRTNCGLNGFKLTGQGVVFPDGFSFGKIQLYRDSVPFHKEEKFDAVFFENDCLSIRGKYLWRECYVYFEKWTNFIRVLLPKSEAFNCGRSTLAFIDGRRATNLDFNDMNSFNEGRMLVSRLGGGYGFLDEKLDFIVAPQYSMANDFHNGFAIVELEEQRGKRKFYINKEGKELITKGADGHKTEYKRLKNFDIVNGEKRARVSIEDISWSDLRWGKYGDCAGMWGFIDDEGNEVVPPQYIYAMDFDDNLAPVCKGKWVRDENGILRAEEARWGLIDQSGDEIIPCQFDEVKKFSVNAIKCEIIEGAMDYEFEHFFTTYEPEALMTSSEYFAVREKDLWGVMDRDGQWVIEPTFGDVGDDLSNGCITFCLPGNTLHMNEPPTGVYDLAHRKVLFEPQELEVCFIDEDMFWVKPDSGEDKDIQIYDRYGREDWFTQYIPVTNFEDADGKKFFLARTFGGDEWDDDKNPHGIISEGRLIVPCLHYIGSPLDIDTEHGLVIFKEDGKSGVMDFKGNVVIPAIYHRIYKYEGGFFDVIDNEKFLHGLFLFDGTCVLPCKYSSIDLKGNMIIACDDDNDIEYILSIVEKTH